MFTPIEQPPLWEFAEADSIFMKQMYLPKKGMVVPQHAHAYDHYTLLAHGALHVFSDEQDFGVVHAPKPIFIKAGVKHTLISMEPETVAYCIHNLTGRKEVEIVAEHQLEIAPCGA